MKKRKYKISVKNGMRDKVGKILGRSDEKGNIEINVKGHHDRRELASTIKHEMLHVKHPKMTEKEVYKRTAKTKIPEQEQSKLIAKLKNKTRNYKIGALKRKYKLGRGDTKPGEFINRVNQQVKERGLTETPNNTQVAIRGLV